MINEKKVLGLIPARGGSKGLPKKNIRPLYGKPLIQWSIDASLGSKYIDELIVSTDSDEIAEVAISAGAKVPFLRPADLASDTAPSIDVILHAISWEEKTNAKFDYLVLLEPTSPLRDSSDIDKSIEILDSDLNAESIVGVCKVEGAHPDFLCSINEGLLIPFYKEFFAKRRQDIKDYYYFEGSIYISRIDALKKKKGFYHDKTKPYIVQKWKSFEIDDMIDFLIVERMMELKQKGSLHLV